MKRYLVAKTPISKPVHISGTSQTIPGLAPDLQTLLAAAAEGEPLPRYGNPRFDESEDAGLTRVAVGDLPPEEIMSAYQNAKAKPEQESGEDSPVPASPNEAEAERSDNDNE